MSNLTNVRSGWTALAALLLVSLHAPLIAEETSTAMDEVVVAAPASDAIDPRALLDAAVEEARAQAQASLRSELLISLDAHFGPDHDALVVAN